jgi:small conductance mechanosensitive channel
MFDISTTDIISLTTAWLLDHGVKIVIILVGAYIGVKILHRVIHKAIWRYVTEGYEGKGTIAQEKRMNTLHEIAVSALNIGAVILGSLMVLSEIGIDIGPLIATAGIAGIAVGFGGQYLIRDIIAGLFIILEDMYRKGDVVKIAGVAGLVEEITLRDTVLRDLDGIQHFVPNGEITIASNMTKFWSRAHLNIGVSYDTNLEDAINVLNEVGAKMAVDEEWKDKFEKPISVVGVDNFGDSSIDIKVLGDTKPGDQWDVMREYRKRIKMAFDDAKIEIPFPQRTVHMKKS